jgi:hypothetical protein
MPYTTPDNIIYINLTSHPLDFKDVPPLSLGENDDLTPDFTVDIDETIEINITDKITETKTVNNTTLTFQKRAKVEIDDNTKAKIQRWLDWQVDGHKILVVSFPTLQAIKEDGSIPLAGDNYNIVSTVRATKRLLIDDNGKPIRIACATYLNTL